MTDKADQGIAARTVRGMFWSYGSFLGVRLSSLVTTAVLARLLAPRDFGLIALATTFIAFLDMLQGLGVSDALVISEPDELADEADSAFIVSLAVGLLLWMASAALGPPSSVLFRQPRLVEILPAIGATFFLNALGSTHYAIAMKHMDFRSRTIAELTSALIRGVVGVGLALAGFGVWALIGGYLAGSLALSAVMWCIVEWRPRLRVQRKHLRRLLGFGGALTGVGITGAFLSQFDNAVVGRVLGATQLGYYSIATRLPYLFIITLASVAGQVLYPAFAALSGEALVRGFLTSLRYTSFVVLPLTAVLITLADPLTLLAFGPHWRPAVAPTQVLCVWAMMSPVNMVCGYAFRSRGRGLLMLALAVPQGIALVVGSLMFVHDGIVAVSWVQAVIAIVAQAVTLVVACRMFAVSPSRLWTSIGPPVLAACVLAAVLYAIRRTFASPAVEIVVGGAAGAIVYFGLVHLIAADILRRLRVMAFPNATP